MAVLTRDALESSPLADLHVIAAELGIDGFRRLRKADLVDAILARQGGEDAATDDEDADAEEAEAEEPRAAAAAAAADAAATPTRTSEADADADGADEPRTTPRDATRDDERDERRGARRPRGGRGRAPRPPTTARPATRRARRRGHRRAARQRLGLPARHRRPSPSDDDVYISAAQVRRCELVSGDKVTGPVRPPRRSERYPSLVRIDTINGRSADEVAEGTPFDDLPVHASRPSASRSAPTTRR